MSKDFTVTTQTRVKMVAVMVALMVTSVKWLACIHCDNRQLTKYEVFPFLGISLSLFLADETSPRVLYHISQCGSMHAKAKLTRWETHPIDLRCSSSERFQWLWKEGLEGCGNVLISLFVTERLRRRWKYLNQFTMNEFTSFIHSWIHK